MFTTFCRIFRSKSRPSQIACMHTTLNINKNLYMVLIPLCKINLSLPISHTDYNSFKKIKTTTTTAFLISNTVVPNSYSHSTAFNPQYFAPLSKFQVGLIDLSQSDIQILYDLQIDNSMGQCVNSN